MKDIVYFDLETRRSAAQVGGWHRIDRMGVSAAVTYSSASDCYIIYGEEEVEALIEQLRRADLVVGYNHLHFDYRVLQAFSMWELSQTTANFDVMVDIERRVGHRLKLDAVAGATLGLNKTADGMQALRWWAEYEKTKNMDLLMDIARYCCFDVKVTRDVFLYGAEHGEVRYPDKATGEIITVPVDWHTWM